MIFNFVDVSHTKLLDGFSRNFQDMLTKKITHRWLGFGKCLAIIVAMVIPLRWTGILASADWFCFLNKTRNTSWTIWHILSGYAITYGISKATISKTADFYFRLSIQILTWVIFNTVWKPLMILTKSTHKFKWWWPSKKHYCIHQTLPMDIIDSLLSL